MAHSRCQDTPTASPCFCRLIKARRQVTSLPLPTPKHPPSLHPILSTRPLSLLLPAHHAPLPLSSLKPACMWLNAKGRRPWRHRPGSNPMPPHAITLFLCPPPPHAITLLCGAFVHALHSNCYSYAAGARMWGKNTKRTHVMDRKCADPGPKCTRYKGASGAKVLGK